MITQKLQQKNTREIRDNYQYFLQHKEDLIDKHEGKFVLIHSKQFIDFYDSFEDADQAGMKLYGLGLYSIQEVTDRIETIGVYGVL